MTYGPGSGNQMCEKDIITGCGMQGSKYYCVGTLEAGGPSDPLAPELTDIHKTLPLWQDTQAAYQRNCFLYGLSQTSCLAV